MKLWPNIQVSSYELERENKELEKELIHYANLYAINNDFAFNKGIRKLCIDFYRPEDGKENFIYKIGGVVTAYWTQSFDNFKNLDNENKLTFTFCILNDVISAMKDSYLKVETPLFDTHQDLIKIRWLLEKIKSKKRERFYLFTEVNIQFFSIRISDNDEFKNSVEIVKILPSDYTFYLFFRKVAWKNDNHLTIIDSDKESSVDIYFTQSQTIIELSKKLRDAKWNVRN